MDFLLILGGLWFSALLALSLAREVRRVDQEINERTDNDR